MTKVIARAMLFRAFMVIGIIDVKAEQHDVVTI